jgi:hypothetical protein
VRAPEFLSQTWVFEGFPDAGSIEELTLTEENGRTRLVAISKFQKKEHLQGLVDSGMEAGMQEGYERLDELLETLG